MENNNFAGCTSDCSTCGESCEQNLKQMEDGRITVTLTLDDDTEMECLVLTTFEAEGNEYIALLPTNAPEGEEGEVYLYKYLVRENGAPDLANIETDEEYEIATEAFEALLEQNEFDDIIAELDAE